MKKKSIGKIIEKNLERFPQVSLGILYGSAAASNTRFNSDVDLAIAGEESLSKDLLIKIVESLATELNRPIDLVDLTETTGTLLHQILTKGKLIYCTDRVLYALLIKKMLYNQTDMMPYHYRILKERREEWINKS